MTNQLKEEVIEILRKNLSIEIRNYTEYGEKGIQVSLVLLEIDGRFETISEDRVVLESWED